MLTRLAGRCASAWPFLALALVAMLGGCATLHTDFVREPSSALPAATDTSSARYIASELKRHPQLSGFRLLTRSTNALLSRVALADHAAHSIDLQYYLFHNDSTGRVLAQHLLAAADRGVRVRILLDDMNLSDSDRMLDALDAHENIQVRLFNPFRTRNPSLPSKVGQFLLEGRRLNRRMHNKSFITDGTAAVIGGRNIGDGYFDAGADTNFRDLDVIGIGPVVAEAARIFDDYWNSEASFPVAAFDSVRDTQADLIRLRKVLAGEAREFAESDYLQESLEELPDGATADRRGEWFWGKAEVVADQPEKVDDRRDTPSLSIGPRLKTMIEAAETEICMISPYLIPGDSGTAFLVGLAKRGIKVQILTNSLASSDEPAAHSKYALYRRPLLEGGVQLYELRPAPGELKGKSAHGTSSGVSLHAKAVVVDQRVVFIGSLNMDQRSKVLNTEMGVIIDSPALAQAVHQFFDTVVLPENAYHVVLQGAAGSVHPQQRMTWLWSAAGRPRNSFSDPETTAKKRIQVFVLGKLPIEGQL